MTERKEGPEEGTRYGMCRRCGLVAVGVPGADEAVCQKCRSADEARALMVRSIDLLGQRLRLERVRLFGMDMVAVVDASMTPGQIEMRARDGRLLGVLTGVELG